jgi:hypothetical protein
MHIWQMARERVETNLSEKGTVLQSPALLLGSYLLLERLATRR